MPPVQARVLRRASSVVVIVPERGGKDFAPDYVLLDMAQDPFMATVFRTALVVALEEFFGRVQVSRASLVTDVTR